MLKTAFVLDDVQQAGLLHQAGPKHYFRCSAATA